MSDIGIGRDVFQIRLFIWCHDASFLLLYSLIFPCSLPLLLHAVNRHSSVGASRYVGSEVISIQKMPGVQQYPCVSIISIVTRCMPRSSLAWFTRSHMVGALYHTRYSSASYIPGTKHLPLTSCIILLVYISYIPLLVCTFLPCTETYLLL